MEESRELEYLKEEMNKIKNGEDSFLGIDGGNISDSKIWVCGVEFGGTLKDMGHYLKNTVKYDEKDGFKFPYRINAGEFENSKYDLFLSEFIIKLFGLKDVEKNKYLKDNLYNLDSNIFKLNLYPLAKKDTSWDKTYDEIFTITKEEYYGYIFNKRKKFFKKLIKKFSPETIICSITKNSECIFADAFFEHEKDWVKVKWEVVNGEVSSNKLKKFKVSIYKKDNLSIIMIPFFGMGTGNLNSYDDVIFMAEYLKENYRKLVDTQKSFLEDI